MSTYNEAQIQARHQERVSALVDLFGSTHLIPRDLIDRLQERNKEDWVRFVAERDGKEKGEPAPLMPEVTDADMAIVNAEEIPDEPYGTDEPDAQTVADCDDAVELLAEQNGETA